MPPSFPIQLPQSPTFRGIVTLGERPTCPVCSKPVHGVTFARGLVVMRCEYKHCPATPRAKFRAIALPPGSRGAVLLRLFGDRAAHTLARELFSNAAAAASAGLSYSLEALELIPPGPTWYLTILLVGPSYYRSPCASEWSEVVRVTSAV